MSFEMMPEKDSDKERYARENHSEIERRRRNKMTAYITELSDMVPQCNVMQRKPDKLTILRLAVAHMKSLRGTGNTHNGDGAYKPSFLTDQELKHLILEAADGFLFVVACDTGRVIYASDSITPVLNHPQYEFQNSCFYDWIHPDDLPKVREQLSTQDVSNSSRILDMKSGTVKKESHQSAMRLCIGSRRAFICKMRLGNAHMGTMSPTHLHRLRQRNSLGPATDGHHYAVVHCTGYTKNWPTSNISMERIDSEDPNAGHCCLVAIGRLQVVSSTYAQDSNNTNQTEFMSRHSRDGRITFVDQRVVNVLGYQPHELIGSSVYDHLHVEDVGSLRDTFEEVVNLRGQTLTVIYKFKSKESTFVHIRIQCFAFLNPYTSEVEYIVCTNTLVDRNGTPISIVKNRQPTNTTHTDLSINQSISNRTQNDSGFLQPPSQSDDTKSQQSKNNYSSTYHHQQPANADNYNLYPNSDPQSNENHQLSYNSSTQQSTFINSYSTNELDYMMNQQQQHSINNPGFIQGQSIEANPTISHDYSNAYHQLPQQQQQASLQNGPDNYSNLNIQ